MSDLDAPAEKKQKLEGANELVEERRKHVAKVLGIPVDTLIQKLANVHPPYQPSGTALAPLIDHTILRADATKEQIAAICLEARHHGFASVCVNACWVPTCVDLLRGSEIRVCSVVGFPLGATASAVKAYEAQNAVSAGAQEVDMVMNIGWLKEGSLQAVLDDIRAVVNAVPPSVTVKVILEVCLLERAQIVDACILCTLAGATFVKTSTGFSTHGATPESVALMAAAVAGSGLQVKAAGGVKTVSDARKYVDLGVTRIGTSAGVALLEGGAVIGY